MSGVASLTFQQKISFGKLGESQIANYFKARGYHALPIYEKEINEGKGPQLFGLNEKLIAPDLLVFQNRSKVFWIEAKHKSVFSWHRITQRWVTGIDLRHYSDYLKVAEVSPWPVWLFFLHQNGYTDEYPYDCPTGLFGGDIKILSRKENHRSDRYGRSGMVYWAHSSLKQIATLEELNLVQYR